VGVCGVVRNGMVVGVTPVCLVTVAFRAQDFLIGYNGTIFAYGQTGTGKTFTMLGPDAEPDMSADIADVDVEVADGGIATGKGMLANTSKRGIVPRAFMEVFSTVRHVHACTTITQWRSQRVCACACACLGLLAFCVLHQVASNSDKYQYTMTMSYVQIYCEIVTDLLSDHGQSLSVREDTERGVYIEGVTSFPVSSMDDCMRLISAGHENRVTASTRFVVCEHDMHKHRQLTPHARCRVCVVRMGKPE